MSPNTVLRLGVLLALTASACTGAKGEPSPSASSSVPDPVTVKVAYFDDLTLDEPYQHALPALQGVQLAFTRAADAGETAVVVEVEELDTEGDVAAGVAFARQVAADPSYVAAVAAPFWSEPDEVGAILDDAGLVTLGLSELGAPTDDWSGRVRMVPTRKRQVDEIARYLRKSSEAGGVCVAHDATPYGTTLATSMAHALGHLASRETIVLADDAQVTAAAESVRDAACSVVMWAGFGESGAALRVALTEAGLDPVRMVGSDAIKTDGYLEDAPGSGEGTIVTCGCVDLSTSTELAAQVFIHDFQSEFGSAPGMFAAEGLDAGNLVLDALRAGDPTRESVRSAVTSLDTFDGLAGTYVFVAGELGEPHIAFFEDRSQRWAPFEPGEAP